MFRRLITPFMRWNCSKTRENHLTELLRTRFAPAESASSPTSIRVTDISGGCGSMYEVFVSSREFESLPLVKQHKLVSDTLRKEIKEMHGIRITTEIASTPPSGDSQQNVQGAEAPTYHRLMLPKCVVGRGENHHSDDTQRIQLSDGNVSAVLNCFSVEKQSENKVIVRDLLKIGTVLVSPDDHEVEMHREDWIEARNGDVIFASCVPTDIAYATKFTLMFTTAIDDSQHATRVRDYFIGPETMRIFARYGCRGCGPSQPQPQNQNGASNPVSPLADRGDNLPVTPANVNNDAEGLPDFSGIIKQRKVVDDRDAAANAASSSAFPTAEVPPQFNCAICCDVMIRPAITSPCGHTFCGGCLSMWLASNRNCPECRATVQGTNRNNSLSSLIDSYLEQNPHHKRADEEIQEIECRDTITFPRGGGGRGGRGGGGGGRGRGAQPPPVPRGGGRGVLHLHQRGAPRGRGRAAAHHPAPVGRGGGFLGIGDALNAVFNMLHDINDEEEDDN